MTGDLLQRRTILESPRGDGRQRGGQRELGQTTATVESVGIDVGDTLWYDKLLERGAFFKDALWDVLWLPLDPFQMTAL